MAITKDKLAKIIGNAQKLCTPEGDRMISEARNNNNKNGYDPNPDSYTDSDSWDSLYLSKPTNMSSKNDELAYGNDEVMNSNLPRHIKESLARQQIDMNSNISIVDELGLGAIKRPVQEQTRPQVQKTQQPVLNTATNVDYSIIKAIFNECLREYFDNKQQLNESASLQTIGLQNGNISLVDNKGNIYKAKLEKIGNKNDKK